MSVGHGTGMFRYLTDKMHNYAISLRFGILSVFILFFASTLGLAVLIFYVHLIDIVHSAGLLLMRETSTSISQELNLQLTPVQFSSLFSARNIRQHVINTRNEQEMIAYLVHILKSLPLAQGAYWSDADGSFIFVRKRANGDFSAEVINRRRYPAVGTLYTLDNMHQVKASQPVVVKFDPRQDRWFQAAKAKKNVLWTDAYVYQYDLPFIGMSALAPAITDSGEFLGVFGIDVSLDNLSESFRNKHTLV